MSVERTVPAPRTAKNRCSRKLPISFPPFRRFTGVKAARGVLALGRRTALLSRRTTRERAAT
jgi:hypothetical protein